MDQTVKTLTPRAHEKGLKLICDVSGQVPDRLIGDALRLRQVLTNLIGNATKFTHQGEIVVRVKAEGAESREQGAGSRDEGLGTSDRPDASSSIPDPSSLSLIPHLLSLIPHLSSSSFIPRRDPLLGFRHRHRHVSPGTRADLHALRSGRRIHHTALRRHGPGTEHQQEHCGNDGRPAVGREPAGSRQHVPLHRAVSDDRAGCRARAAGATVRRARVPLEKAARSLRILLAEDNLANQKVAMHFLGQRGHTVEIAHNGSQALEKISQQPFDVVLMDVQMPEMDGFEATAAIRALPDLCKAKMPIVAMTAHALKGDRETVPGGGHGRLPRQADRCR